MERQDIIEMMRILKLAGMRAAFDELVATGIKRQHSAVQIIGDLLQAEIAEKQARSIKYQIAIARLPLAKELADFDFADTPINEGLVRDLATGAFLEQQRNAVLVGGTGTGKSHLAVAIARSCIRGGARGRFHTAVDLVNRLEAEARAGRQEDRPRHHERPQHHVGALAALARRREPLRRAVHELLGERSAARWVASAGMVRARRRSAACLLRRHLDSLDLGPKGQGRRDDE